MNDSGYWTIRPLVGLGPLAFGMKPKEVASYHAAYGAPDIATSAVPEESFEETMKMLSQYLSADDIAAARRGHEQQKAITALRRELYTENGLSLEYDDNGLVTIQISPEALATNFNSENIFPLDARKVLALFELANGMPGRYRSTHAAFDNIAISLSDFSIAMSDGTVQPLQSSDERFAERTVEIRRTPYIPSDEITQYVDYSFLK